jgi:protein ImuB
MRRRLREATGTDPRLGLGPGPFTARVAALQARPGRAIQVIDAANFLAPLPAYTLDLEAWQLERLELLGLRSLGAVAAVGPRRLESQLGRAGRLAAERAAGLEPDRIDAWAPPSCSRASRQFENSIEEREALLFVARALCGDLAVELGLRGAGAKRVRVRLGIEDKAAEERESIVRQPLSSQAELFGLIGAWLRSWQPAAPVTEMSVELPELEPAGRRQLRLWVRGDGSAEEVKAALERLQERHGEEIALRVEPALVEGAIPSQRYRLLPLGATSPTPRPAPAAAGRHEMLSEPAVSRNLGFFPSRAP